MKKPVRAGGIGGLLMGIVTERTTPMRTQGPLPEPHNPMPACAIPGWWQITVMANNTRV